MTSINEILTIAKEAAKLAAGIQLAGLRDGLNVQSKGASFDLVTDADVNTEKAVTDLIHTHFPDHNILGEEDEYPATDSPWLWIIDPIDGTTNFARGIPYFSLSIAVWHQGQPVAAVVSNPVSGELFSAGKGLGAWLNDQPIRASDRTLFTQSVLITGFYYERGLSMEKTLANVRKFLTAGVLGIRRFGSAALDLCYVAAGRADGFFEIGLNAWDFSGGAFIAQEAGALVTGLDGLPLKAEKSYVIAGAPGLHAQILETLRATEREF